MLSVRGIALLTLLLTIISLGLYMGGVPNQYFAKSWKMTNSVWSAISIVLLIIGASICFYQSVQVYKDSAHCEFGPEEEILGSVMKSSPFALGSSTVSVNPTVVVDEFLK